SAAGPVAHSSVGNIRVCSIQRGRSVADRKMIPPKETLIPLFDNALQLVIREVIELKGRADLRSLDAMAGENADFFDRSDATAQLPAHQRFLTKLIVHLDETFGVQHGQCRRSRCGGTFNFHYPRL